MRNRFGSFGASIAAAGLHPRPDGVDVRWSDEAIVDALRDVAYEQGRRPRPGDLEASAEDLQGVEVVVLGFGSWQSAITEAGLGSG